MDEIIKRIGGGSVRSQLHFKSNGRRLRPGQTSHIVLAARERDMSGLTAFVRGVHHDRVSVVFYFCNARASYHLRAGLRRGIEKKLI